MTASPDRPVPPAPRPAVVLAWTLGALLLAVAFFSPARQVADPELDPSNYATYARFTALGQQYGPEVMPLAGPYGFVPYGFLYAGHLFGARLALEFLTKAALGALILWLIARAQGAGPARWLWVPLLLVMTPMVEDLPYDLAVLFTGLGLVHFHARPGRPALAVAAALAAFLALLTLFKGTQAVLAVATFGLLSLQAMLLRDFRRWGILALVFGAALVGWLLLAGQDPRNFPLYLRAMLELSAGYNLAMGLQEPTGPFLAGAAVLVVLQALVVALFAPRWRDPVAAAAGLFFAGFTFIKWKHGFVRADGHVLIFFHYACVAAPAMLLFARGCAAPAGPGWIPARLAPGLATVAFALALWTGGAAPLDRLTWSTRAWLDRLDTTVRQLAAPAADRDRLEAALARQRDAYELSALREEAGTAPVDFFGTELGHVFLGGLDYRPRPVGGGTFSVFSRWLQDRNLVHVSDPARRPAYFLVNPSTIDHRLLAQDDPGTLLALIHGYEPVAAEQDMVLYRARDGAGAPPEPVPVATVPTRLGQTVPVPEVGADELLLVSFDLPFNLAGRARAFLYKAPFLFVDVAGEGLEAGDSRRLVPGLATRPLLLDPFFENGADLLSLHGPERRKRVRTLTLRSPQPGYWRQDSFAVRFHRVRRPAPIDPERLARLQGVLAYPMADTTPLEVKAAGAPLRRFSGLLVQMLEPPAQIRLPLGGDEREVSFKYGVDDAAYLEGRTDGVEFLVDVDRPGQPPQTLFRRWLRPGTVPADRGVQRERVLLPPLAPGATLLLRTEPGHHGDGAWDWGYVTAIRLHRGPYRPEQFPGFDRLPETVEAASSGAMPIDGKPVFMLPPPGSLVFALRGDERRVAITARLLEAAYTGGNQSDGFGVALALEPPGGPAVTLVRRVFEPRERAEDRGDQTVAADLPDFPPGTRLRVTLDPGAHGSAAWDWCFISSLRLD